MAEPPNPELTYPERRVLLYLATQGVPVRNPDLQVPTLTAASRTKLEAAGLIEITVVQRANTYTLTAAGWDYCHDSMTEPAPPGARPDGRLLAAVLRSVHAQLVRDGKSLGEILSPAEDPETEPATTAPAPAGRGRRTVEARIRAAVAELAPNPEDWLPIHRLRAALTDIPRTDLDAALNALYGTDGVEIVADSNRKALTAAARAGAVRIGVADRHVMRVRR